MFSSSLGPFFSWLPLQTLSPSLTAMAWKRYGLKRYGVQSPETLLRVLLGFKRYGLKRSMG